MLTTPGIASPCNSLKAALPRATKPLKHDAVDAADSHKHRF
jgi:hypothetical protein